MNVRRSLAPFVVVVAAGSVLAACSDSSSHSSMSDVTIPASANFNATDVGFAQGMIPHHAQAIDMADMAIARSTNADVLALARQIKAAQGPEIDTMTSWLTSWGQPIPATTGTHDMTGMDHMMMDGMMSQSDMTRLAGATGTAFDRMWLEMMVLHHEGAVKMAKQELADGKDAGAKRLAHAIIDGQTAEITTMNALIAALPS